LNGKEAVSQGVIGQIEYSLLTTGHKLGKIVADIIPPYHHTTRPLIQNNIPRKAYSLD